MRERVADRAPSELDVVVQPDGSVRLRIEWQAAGGHGGGEGTFTMSTESRMALIRALGGELSDADNAYLADVVLQGRLQQQSRSPR